jgi:protein-S-isoprenylcysteine O-methyltransferase Ste14
MGSRGEVWVLVQALLLVLLLLMPPVGPAWLLAGVFNGLGWSACFGAVLLLAKSVINLGRSLTPFPKPLAGSELVTSGAYRLVRHPIYLGVLLGALGFSLLSHSPMRLLITVALFIFFDQKASREELWLEERYPSYPAYKLRVKKLIPWLY